MGIYLKPINLSCAEKLLEFEMNNRKFFKKTCPFALLNGEWHDSVEYEKVLTKSSK